MPGSSLYLVSHSIAYAPDGLDQRGVDIKFFTDAPDVDVNVSVNNHHIITQRPVQQLFARKRSS